MATILPFLYQTRTIQRFPKTRVSTPALRAFFHATTTAAAQRRKGQGLGGSAIPFEFPPGTEHHDPDIAMEDVPPGHQPTITPGERNAFERIFQEIATRGARATPSAKPAASALDTVIPSGAIKTQSPNKGNVESARDEIGIIMSDAAAAQAGSWRPAMQPFGPTHMVGQVSAAANPTKALMRFPPSLRQAARAALSAFETERAESSVGGEEAANDGQVAASPLMTAVEEEKRRVMERERVEKRLRGAKTDFELWGVMESEVFSLVQKLGLDKDPEAPKKRTKKSRGKKDIAAGGDAEKTFSMNIHGPLYPSYLVTALRLMDENFERSSPLALNILPRIKALGLQSYVLGVSTAFYNELARIYWYRHGNAEAVFNLLEEMRHSGLFCDNDTYSIVNDIANVFGRSANGAGGPFLRELVSMPEYEFALAPRIEHWMKTISAQAVERREEQNQQTQ